MSHLADPFVFKVCATLDVKLKTGMLSRVCSVLCWHCPISPYSRQHSQYCFMRANLDNELEYPIDEETFESLTEKVLEQAILMRAAFQVDEDNEAAIARVSRSKGQ